MLGDRADVMRSAEFLAKQWGLDWLNKTPVRRVSLLSVVCSDDALTHLRVDTFFV